MSNQEGIQNAYCDGVRGMINYMMYQHVPRSYGQLNEFLPHHLYYDRILPPFAMKMAPASNICNRFVIKRSMRYREKVTPTSAVWFPDSDFVVTSLNSGMLVKWDAVTYTHKGRKSVSNTSINCMRLSHDGQFIIAAGDNGNVFYLTKALTESCPLKNDQESILACAISARDNFVITGGDNKYIKVWKIAANEITFERNLGELQNSVTSVDASGVGSLVLSGCKDGSVGVWDLRTRKSLKRLTDNDEQINVVRFCPTNENYFITAGKGRTIRLYDARTFCQLRSFRGHNYDITALAFSPEDGTMFVSGDYNGHLNYWSIYNELPLYTATKAHDRSIKDICFSPLSLAMVSLGDDNYIKFWQRNRPGDREELVASNFATFRIPMSRNIDYSNNDSFKIDLMIPSIGKIDQDNVSTVNMQLPPTSSTASGANSFESRSEEQAYYREDDSEKPPRNFCCIRCDRNGHWSHKCENTQKKSICSRCQGDHFIDVCPYRADVGPAYECKECRGNHYRDDCPKIIRNRKKTCTAPLHYNNLIRIQEGKPTVKEI